MSIGLLCCVLFDHSLCRLLQSLGCKKAGAMLIQGGDTDLLEQVLILVLEGNAENSEENTEGSTVADWLTLLSECSQFNMMIQLVSADLLARVELKLEICGASNVDELKEKYQRKRKS